MKRIAIATSLLVIGLAGCASTGSSDPAAMAARGCEDFARGEGARPVSVEGVDTVSDGDANYKVRMRVEDRVSRKVSAECLYSSTSNRARWATPLPEGFARI